MYLHVVNCATVDPGFLEDLGRYKAVDEYVEEILKGSAKTHPMTCIVFINDTEYYVTKNGFFAEGAHNVLEILKRVKPMAKHIPNDDLKITFDGYEDRLTIEVKV